MKTLACCIEALLGLLTNVGMVVANAAYDTNTTDIEVFLALLLLRVKLIARVDIQQPDVPRRRLLVLATRSHGFRTFPTTGLMRLEQHHPTPNIYLRSV